MDFHHATSPDATATDLPHQNNTNTYSIPNNNNNSFLLANSLLRNFNLDSKEFKKLLDTQSLVDCTLACDGGKISAHKVVLSACSSYLAAILAEHPVEHPIIILPELSIDDVRTLVHYMYTGELLKSDTQHSTSLLKTAAILSVNSLNDFLSGTATANNQANPPTSNITTTTSLGLVNSRFDDNQSVNSNDVNNGRVQRQQQQQQYRSKQHHLSYPHNNNNNNTPSKSNQSLLAGGAGGGGSGSAVSRHSGSSILANNTISVSNICSSTNSTTGNKPEFQFKCPVCENTIRQTICSFEYHMQKVHNVTSFGCEICHKPFASLRYVLTDHMRRCHRWKAEQNLQC